MKKLFLVLAITILACAASFAEQKSGTITLTVLVKGNFYLMVNTDSFDFARLMPGQTGEMARADGVAVTGSSTNGNPWYLKVTANPLASGSNLIPSENFTWYGTSEGQGEWRGSQEKSFSDSSRTAYVSSAAEADGSAKAVNRFKFRLHVPEDTKAGAYTTTVMFTMTE